MPDLAGGIPLITGLVVFVAATAIPREEAPYATLIGLLGLAGIILAGLLANSVTGITLSVICIALALAVTLGGSAEITRAAGRRYLTWMAISSSALLFSISLDRLNAQDPTLALTGPVAALFFIGIGILLAAPPFSLWLPELAQEAPGVAALMVGVLGCGVAMIGSETAEVNPWQFIAVTAPPGFVPAVGALAVISTLVALGEKHPNRSFAYLISANAGLLLAFFIARPPDTSSIAIFAFGVHALAAALGLSVLATTRGQIEGLIWRRPLNGGTLIICALSLIGFPLTAGFIGRTLLAQSMLEASPGLLVISGLTCVIGGLAFLRNFESIFHRIDVTSVAPRLSDLIALGLALALLLRGVVPGPILSLFR